MKCYYINFYADGSYFYYDLIINNENDELYIRLNGAVFNEEPNIEELISFCLERVRVLDQTLIVNKIFLRNGDTCIYDNG